MPNNTKAKKPAGGSAKTTAKAQASTKANATTKTEEPAVENQAGGQINVKEVDPSQYVTVRNGFHGTLVYRSSKTGETFLWDEFGAEQEMELRELRNAKSTHKKYFANNWFMFDEDWIPHYLGVFQYYQNALPIDGFDDIFQMNADDLKQRIGQLSDGQKKSVAYRAKELIAEHKIDSISVIDVLEEALHLELIER